MQRYEETQHVTQNNTHLYPPDINHQLQVKQSITQAKPRDGKCSKEGCGVFETKSSNSRSQ
jgi:hypothetical protein